MSYEGGKVSKDNPSNWDDLNGELQEIINDLQTINQKAEDLYMKAKNISDQATQEQEDRVRFLCLKTYKTLFESVQYWLIGILYFVQQSTKKR